MIPAQLPQVFVPYKTFPISKYTPGTPARAFQALYPNDHYALDITTFLALHNYTPTQRGADLPWWGAKFFATGPGCRVMVIGQDSYTEDAGSIVFYAALFSLVDSEHAYRPYIARLTVLKTFPYTRWKGIRDQLTAWGVNVDFCYITDAAKVYKTGSWKDKDYDRRQSVQLLKDEIRLCNPDLIILLGKLPYALLIGKPNYAAVVDAGKPIKVEGADSVVSPFPIGQGWTQPGFRQRLAIASGLIKSLVGPRNTLSSP